MLILNALEEGYFELLRLVIGDKILFSQYVILIHYTDQNQKAHITKEKFYLKHYKSVILFTSKGYIVGVLVRLMPFG